MAWKNQLYFGDNLDILRNEIKDESIDLVYLDPPFNSKAKCQRKLSSQLRAVRMPAFL
jgi:16S rRNA G966 N2-methylase RsmD